MLDKNTIAQDFPILDQFVHDEPLVYLDNACLLYTSRIERFDPSFINLNGNETLYNMLV